MCLCIAVLHHLSTAERRLAGLRELVRVTRPGGLVLVYVWALEQEVKKVKKKHLKEVEFTGNKETSENMSDNSSTRLLVNASRESFEQQDLFVPWKYSGPGKQQEKQRQETEGSREGTEGHVYHRYYHVFQDGELRELCSQLNHVIIEEHYYDKGNWCVVLRKNK